MQPICLMPCGIFVSALSSSGFLALPKKIDLNFIEEQIISLQGLSFTCVVLVDPAYTKFCIRHLDVSLSMCYKKIAHPALSEK